MTTESDLRRRAEEIMFEGSDSSEDSAAFRKGIIDNMLAFAAEQRAEGAREMLAKFKGAVEETRHCSSILAEEHAWQRACDEISTWVARLITSPADDGKVPLKVSTEDVKCMQRLDWLTRQSVTVRTPLRYGSRENFSCSPDIEETHSDLINQIDKSMLTAASDGGKR